jgi:hypothetical protein
MKLRAIVATGCVAALAGLGALLPHVVMQSQS